MLLGDIKPANFMLAQRVNNPLRAIEVGELGPAGWLRVVDFGCSQAVLPERPLCRRTGTPVYMSPETFPARVPPGGRVSSCLPTAHLLSATPHSSRCSSSALVKGCRRASMWLEGQVEESLTPQLACALQPVEPGHDAVPADCRALPLLVSSPAHDLHLQVGDSPHSIPSVHCRAA